MRRQGIGAALLAAMILAGCTASGPPEPQDESGAALYREHCAACHGARGAGDGDLASLVPGGMPDLRDLAARNGGVYPMARVVQAITRISALHEGLVAMPDFGGLFSTAPAVHVAPDGTRIDTDAAVLELAAHIGSLQVGAR